VGGGFLGLLVVWQLAEVAAELGTFVIRSLPLVAIPLRSGILPS
jgi:hypothetical protein